MEDETEELKERYRNFAKYEAAERCQAYFDMAHWVVESNILLRFILKFRDRKRQPNLIFAAVRKVHGVPKSCEEFEQVIREKQDEIAQTINAKNTQTNEPARCAALFLALSQLRYKKIAFIEVGASAGLCMIPDHYHYCFGRKAVVPRSASKQTLSIKVGFDGPMPKVNEHLNFAWRRGIDLNPIDLSEDDACDWLQTLVWPGQVDRLNKLKTAIAEARQYNLVISKGHLLDLIESTVSAAPKDAEVVVYHSAVMNYMKPQEVAKFRAQFEKLNVNWIFQEDSRIFPDLLDPKLNIPKGRFVLACNKNILAHTHTHGSDIVWLRKM